MVDPETGEILLEESTELDEEAMELLERAKVKKIQIYTRQDPDSLRADSPIVKNTLKKDPSENVNVARQPEYAEAVEQMKTFLANGWQVVQDKVVYT